MSKLVQSKLPQLFELKSQNLPDKAIAEKLGISCRTVKYYSNPVLMKKTKITREKYEQANLLQRKLARFNKVKENQKPFGIEPGTVTVDELINKVGPNPKCFLSGEPIDLNNRNSYHLAHIVPRCEGGANTLENMEIALEEYNSMQGGRKLPKFIKACSNVLNTHGYDVIKRYAYVG